MASEGLIPNNNYWRIHSSKKREAVWDRTSPVSSVDAGILQQNTAILERVSMRLPQVNADIATLEDDIKTINQSIVSTTDTGEIVTLANQRNSKARLLEASKTEQSVLKGEERSAMAVVNKNRDEMAEFYRDGPYMTENRAVGMTVLGWLAIGYGAYYLINTENKAGVKFRSAMRQSPVSAAFRNA